MKPFLKSPVREIRTPGSVGVRATSWVASLPGGKAGDRIKRLPIATNARYISSQEFVDCMGLSKLWSHSLGSVLPQTLTLGCIKRGESPWI